MTNTASTWTLLSSNPTVHAPIRTWDFVETLFNGDEGAHARVRIEALLDKRQIVRVSFIGTVSAYSRAHAHRLAAMCFDTIGDSQAPGETPITAEIEIGNGGWVEVSGLDAAVLVAPFFGDAMMDAI